MRRYMPGPHARFLELIESTSNIREYAEQHLSPELSEAYNVALIELGKFRDIHIQIVTRYIITPSRKAGSRGKPGLNIAIVSTNKDSTKGLQGTGGTELLPFLKQSRDETNGTVLEYE
jgi:indoleamine 2,3-dioxygenase